MPICFELAPANTPEREVAAEMLARVELDGYTVIADKGFAGEQFEALMAELGAIFLRPDRKGETPRFGGLGGIRQWIESVFDTFKGQLSLERHGAITMPGLITRIAQRMLALAAGLWHNWNTGQAGRHLTAYDH
jgi:DDE family transposase